MSGVSWNGSDRTEMAAPVSALRGRQAAATQANQASPVVEDDAVDLERRSVRECLGGRRPSIARPGGHRETPARETAPVPHLHPTADRRPPSTCRRRARAHVRRCPRSPPWAARARVSARRPRRTLRRRCGPEASYRSAPRRRRRAAAARPGTPAPGSRRGRNGTDGAAPARRLRRAGGPPPHERRRAPPAPRRASARSGRTRPGAAGRRCGGSRHSTSSPIRKSCASGWRDRNSRQPSMRS